MKLQFFSCYNLSRASGCNIAVVLLQSSYIGPTATNLRSFNEGLYRHVFLVGLVGSLIISTVNGIFISWSGGQSIIDPMMTLRFIVGDMLGLVVTIFFASLIRSYVREFLKRDDAPRTLIRFLAAFSLHYLRSVAVANAAETLGRWPQLLVRDPIWV